MDTRYWGPDGWKLLHTIAYNYPIQPSKDDIQTHNIFFTIIGDILPCKYCRISYKKYINELPIHKHLSTRDELFIWLYNIHNKVNDKLRKQKHLKEEDPSLKEIFLKYSTYPFIDECLLGKKFINAIVHNYPLKGDNPRLKILYYTFFNYLIMIFPNNKNIVDHFDNYPIKNNLNNRCNIKKWFYILSCYVEENCSEILPYDKFCRDCEKHRSKDCSKDNHKGNTCRKK